MVTDFAGGPPSWKTTNEIVRRVTELKIVPASNEVTPSPASGRALMDFPQNVRFNIYERLLSSEDPIVRPWPRTKFAVQLLRLSKDIFAEAAYCFYGKGDQGRDLDDEVDLLSTSDEAREVYMSGIPHCHTNKFQMMMNHATGQFSHPPEPYLSLINHISLSPTLRWPSLTTSTLLSSFPNLTHLTIHVHSLTSIFGDSEPAIRDCAADIYWEDRHTNDNFLREVVWYLSYEDQGPDRLVEVDILQHVLRPQKPINVEDAPLDDWIELPDEEWAVVRWDAQVRVSRAGLRKLHLVNRGYDIFW